MAKINLSLNYDFALNDEKFMITIQTNKWMKIKKVYKLTLISSIKKKYHIDIQHLKHFLRRGGGLVQNY